jgi:A/G-specific adenine glycosylase
MQAKLPVKANRIEKRERFFAFYIMVWRQQVLVRQRVDSDIWQGLFVFDFDEIDDAAQLRKLSADQVLLQKNWNGVKAMPASAVFKQTLTHQHIYARFFEFHFSILPHDIPQGSRWVNKAEFDKIAFPRVIRTYLEERKQFLNNFFAFNLDKL